MRLLRNVPRVTSCHMIYCFKPMHIYYQVDLGVTYRAG